MSAELEPMMVQLKVTLCPLCVNVSSPGAWKGGVPGTPLMRFEAAWISAQSPCGPIGSPVPQLVLDWAGEVGADDDVDDAFPGQFDG
jgi:hypothetical protein